MKLAFNEILKNYGNFETDLTVATELYDAKLFDLLIILLISSGISD
jgi:hypothetical protein